MTMNDFMEFETSLKLLRCSGAAYKQESITCNRKEGRLEADKRRQNKTSA